MQRRCGLFSLIFLEAGVGDFRSKWWSSPAEDLKRADSRLRVTKPFLTRNSFLSSAAGREFRN